jgi:shikimate kinase
VNLVLIGYRGTGKSVVSHRLGAALSRPVVSLDAEIIRAAGRTIPELVQAEGWPRFRDREEEICRRFAAQDGLVIDCGGGVVEREANYGPLRACGLVVWLSASPAAIVARIGGDSQRPSLTGSKTFTEEVEEVLARRTPLYQRLAHVTVETEGRTVGEVTAAVEAHFRRAALK